MMDNKAIYPQCDRLLDQLSKFDSEMLDLGSNINDDSIRLFEKGIGFNLPLDFKYILTLHNGISLMGTEVYGLDDELKESSLNKIYHFEHFGAGNPMPAHFLPFSPDGTGKYYCLDLSKITNGLCPVVFWEHSVTYLSLSNVEVCNNSFIDWVQQVMIDWTLADYNYDGSEK
ncbi:SMI1/KNR4 family protein [Mucilaginibacter gilvus]|uniref:SMI1/KNR4 family protein n=1 Tax=Mucilaginibacter gilvus TaxID=2305909 RepID=A0A444MQS2_9SPHI|nr:SMI1/KNR4 family protein [Mucilaginibacter gilvus]RWY53959.1 SMI1/KNR4 family protein [Mucilaginibacter gilvus]